MKEQQTQRKIEQLQKEIDHLQLKQLFSAKLLDKGTAAVNKSGSLFTYGGYFKAGYDLNGNFSCRFIVDDILVIDL